MTLQPGVPAATRRCSGPLTHGRTSVQVCSMSPILIGAGGAAKRTRPLATVSALTRNGVPEGHPMYVLLSGRACRRGDRHHGAGTRDHQSIVVWRVVSLPRSNARWSGRRHE